jgi:UrcA family protein
MHDNFGKDFAMITRSLIASLALLSAATPALAQDIVSVEINVTDLNLSVPADRERFEVRLKTAARNACRTGYEGKAAREAEQACEEQVIESARAELN